MKLSELIERAENALEPFAKAANEIPAHWPDGRGLLIDENHPDNPKPHSLLIAFVKDFREAGTVFAALKARAKEQGGE